jgi:hypothetical protein
MQPSHILEIEEFPRSSSGKIKKDKLREWVACTLGVAHLSLDKPALHEVRGKGIPRE